MCGICPLTECSMSILFRLDNSERLAWSCVWINSTIKSKTSLFLRSVNYICIALLLNSNIWKYLRRACLYIYMCVLTDRFHDFSFPGEAKTLILYTTVSYLSFILKHSNDLPPPIHVICNIDKSLYISSRSKPTLTCALSHIQWARACRWIGV